jgi:DNA-binding MarR family transcriptional regulator
MTGKLSLSTSRGAGPTKQAAPEEALAVGHFSELLSYRVSLLNRAFEQEAGRNLARQHELSLSETRVLGMLNELSMATVKHLAQVMRLKRPQVSRALALLQEQGLIEALENPADGRSTHYAITRLGQKRARRILAIASRTHRDRLAALTPEERDVLDSVLQKLLRRAAEINNR